MEAPLRGWRPPGNLEYIRSSPMLFPQPGTVSPAGWTPHSSLGSELECHFPVASHLL